MTANKPEVPEEKTPAGGDRRGSATQTQRYPLSSLDTPEGQTLATDAPQDLTGKFVKDRKVIPW